MKLLFAALITISIFLFSCGNDNPVTGNNGEGSTVYTLDSASLWQFQLGPADTTYNFTFNTDLDSFYTIFTLNSNVLSTFTEAQLTMFDSTATSHFFSITFTDTSLNNKTYRFDNFSTFGVNKKFLSIGLAITNGINTQIPKYVSVKNFQVIKK